MTEQESPNTEVSLGVERRLRIAIVAPSVGNAMGHYIDALAATLEPLAQVHLFVPKHFISVESRANTHVIFERSSSMHSARANLSIAVWLRTLRMLRALSPDVVHIMTGEGYPISIIAALWARLRVCALVITVHDPAPHVGISVLDRVALFLGRRAARLAHRIHIHDAAFVEKFRSAEKKIIVIPHPDYSNRFLRYRDSAIEKERMILFFGRLEAYKGIETLAEAVVSLRSPVKCVIAGSGELPATVRPIVAKAPDRFEILSGWVADDVVANLLQRACCVVLPYLNVTQSGVPKLAARFGATVVASNIGTFITEVSMLGGKLVPPGDSAALAIALSQVLTAPIESTPQIQSGLNDEIGRSWLNLYETTLKSIISERTQP